MEALLVSTIKIHLQINTIIITVEAVAQEIWQVEETVPHPLIMTRTAWWIWVRHQLAMLIWSSPVYCQEIELLAAPN